MTIGTKNRINKNISIVNVIVEILNITIYSIKNPFCYGAVAFPSRSSFEGKELKRERGAKSPIVIFSALSASQLGKWAVYLAAIRAERCFGQTAALQSS